MKVSEIPEKDPFPTPRSGHRLVAVQDTLVLFGGYTHAPITGGEIKKDVWCYNVNLGSWKHVTTNDEHFPASTASCAVISHNSKIFVFGGSGVIFGSSNSDKLHILDMATLQWETVTFTGNIIEGGYGHSISLSGDGYLYIYGGCDGFHYFNTMNKICINKWHNSTFYRQNFEGRYRHESIDHNGMIMVFGGGCPRPIEDLGIIPYFCTKKDEWKVMKAKSVHNPPGRVAHSCNKVSNYVVITGGQAQIATPSGDRNFALNDIWFLDLQSYIWTPVKLTLPLGVFFHSGAVGGDDCLYVFGGSTYNRQGSVDRLNVLYKINLFVPSLVELSWRFFLQNFKHVPKLNLVNLGIPKYLVDRV